MKLHPKVKAGGQTGALLTVLLWALETYGHIDPPGYVVAALVTLLAGAGGYMKRSSKPGAIVMAPGVTFSSGRSSGATTLVGDLVPQAPVVTPRPAAKKRPPAKKAAPKT